MVFRVLICVIALSIYAILFIESLASGATIILLWILCIMLPNAIKDRKKWKSSSGNLSKKSLSFGIKSMQRQKENFWVIDKIFSNHNSISSFLKQQSILWDDLHVKFTYGRTSFNSDHNSATDRRLNPAYSHLVDNIYYSSNDDSFRR
jgi:hypothetical protein